MLRHPGMVRRALERVVERDLEAVVPGGAQERPEVGQRAEAGVDRLVPALLVADGPGGARDRRGRPGARCCAPSGSSVRSGGSAAGRSRRSPCAAISGSRSMQSRKVPGRPGTRPWERGNSSYHAANRASGRSTTTSSSWSYRVAAARSGWASRISATSSLRRRRARRSDVARRLELGKPRLEPAPIGAHDAREGAPEERGALEELARDVHAGAHALPQVLGPGPVGVRPRLERVDVPGVLLQEEPAGPAVVAEGLHGRLVPRRVLHGPVAEDGGQVAVALLEDVRRHLEHVAHLALDGEPPTVELGPDVNDPDAADVAARRPIGHGASLHSVSRGARADGPRHVATPPG